MSPRSTVWVLGDQLNRNLAALQLADPSTHKVLFVQSQAKLESKTWHRQRAHLVITSMRRFAAELEAEGFEVDYRIARTLGDGLADHRGEHQPGTYLQLNQHLGQGGNYCFNTVLSWYAQISSCVIQMNLKRGLDRVSHLKWKTFIAGSADVLAI